MGKSYFEVDKRTKTSFRALPTAQTLRDALTKSESADVRKMIFSLFDENTFLETSAFAKKGFSEFLATDKSDEFESVITGYGSVNGNLVFAFAEDSERMGGVIDERHAKKIADLYKLAMKNGAPVVGIFDSKGADVFSGTASLSAYAKIMKIVCDASGIIPQVAYIKGNCQGSLAAIASLFDVVVKNKDANLYMANGNGASNFLSYEGKSDDCVGFIKNMLSFLAFNEVVADDLNRALSGEYSGKVCNTLKDIFDFGNYNELSASKNSSVVTAIGYIGGVPVGVIANNAEADGGKLGASDSRKIARFLTFLDNFNIPVLNLVDSLGLSNDTDSDFADAVSDLIYAYAASENAKITVILGNAIGAAFPILGSKSLGADIVYALDGSTIGALNPEAGVAFAWDKYIDDATTREFLIAEWKQNVNSPAVAAASGEIDDIISYGELRARICSALLMLTSLEG